MSKEIKNNKNPIKESILEISNKKEIPVEEVIKFLEDAMSKAYVKGYPDEKCEVKIDLDKGQIFLFKVFDVVEDNKEDINDYCEIPLSKALKISKNFKVGDAVKEPIDLKKLERNVVAHILQVFKLDINVESNKNVYKQWIDKQGTVIIAEVEKTDRKAKTATVDLGKTMGFVPRIEMNPSESELIPGKSYKFVIKNVLAQTKGWPIILSRADGGLIADLLKTNIPELYESKIEIVKVARVAGFKSKVVVKSNEPGIDPKLAILGSGADRIRPILREMNNEKIEIIKYSDDEGQFIAESCQPAIIKGYKVTPAVYETTETGKQKETKRKEVLLIADQSYLALLIGEKGKNVKLLSELFDADVDVLSTTDAIESKLEYSVAPEQFVGRTSSRNFEQNKFAAIFEKNKAKSNFEINNEIEKQTASINKEISDDIFKMNKNSKNSDKKVETPTNNVKLSESEEKEISSDTEEMEKMIKEIQE